MDVQSLANARTRTDAKLRYAMLTLSELKARGGNGGSDFDRAFEEAFLFHLLGAKEAFLSELNAYYSLDVPERDISPRRLKQELQKQGRISAELSQLRDLEKDKDSWLFHAKEMRNHSTHVAGFPRAFHMGGPNHGKVFPKNPTTGVTVELDVSDALSLWLEKMTTLLEQLRASAISTMHSNPPVQPTPNSAPNSQR